jgi:hypothetical protein
VSASEIKREFCDVLFSIDARAKQSINMKLTFSSKNMTDIPLNQDGITIASDRYVCYNRMLSAIQNNSFELMRSFIYESTEAKIKQASGIIRLLNNYWNNAFNGANPKLVKIIQFSNYSVFFIRSSKKNPFGFYVMYFSVKTINDQDFIADFGNDINLPFLSFIADAIAQDTKFPNDSANEYQYSYPLVQGDDKVFLHFNGEKMSVDLRENGTDDSPLIAFARKAYKNINERFDSYVDFYSAYSADRIRKSTKGYPGVENRLKDSFKDYSKLIFVIDADPLYVLFYEYPEIKGVSMPKFVEKSQSGYHFVNFYMINDVSEVLNKITHTLEDELRRQDMKESVP